MVLYIDSIPLEGKEMTIINWSEEIENIKKEIFDILNHYSNLKNIPEIEKSWEETNLIIFDDNISKYIQAAISKKIDRENRRKIIKKIFQETFSLREDDIILTKKWKIVIRKYRRYNWKSIEEVEKEEEKYNLSENEWKLLSEVLMSILKQSRWEEGEFFLLKWVIKDLIKKSNDTENLESILIPKNLQQTYIKEIRKIITSNWDTKIKEDEIIWVSWYLLRKKFDFIRNSLMNFNEFIRLLWEEKINNIIIYIIERIIEDNFIFKNIENYTEAWSLKDSTPREYKNELENIDTLIIRYLWKQIQINLKKMDIDEIDQEEIDLFKIFFYWKFKFIKQYLAEEIVEKIIENIWKTWNQMNMNIANFFSYFSWQNEIRWLNSRYKVPEIEIKWLENVRSKNFILINKILQINDSINKSKINIDRLNTSIKEIESQISIQKIKKVEKEEISRNYEIERIEKEEQRRAKSDKISNIEWLIKTLELSKGNVSKISAIIRIPIIDKRISEKRKEIKALLSKIESIKTEIFLIDSNIRKIRNELKAITDLEKEKNQKENLIKKENDLLISEENKLNEIKNAIIKAIVSIK